MLKSGENLLNIIEVASEPVNFARSIAAIFTSGWSSVRT
jgi:hypothetical protein